MQTNYLTNILNSTDKKIFTKIVQIYFFFKQDLSDISNSEIHAKLDEGASLTYSLIRHFLVNESIELSYLEEINELLREINVQSKEENIELQIPANSVHEIELQKMVPMQFTDADTHEKLQVLYQSVDGVILWNLKTE